ncbi:hypothetical protein [Marinimicrobium alkaliphilum]|uniref:hypothetical protein n=1 Tax=Marinimicrobium alkaliphilum TaxID=2202654 RepID=UPI000DB9FD99|nr:hypothetical protein [Marinimicrobium alkaliphilum]
MARREIIEEPEELLDESVEENTLEEETLDDDTEVDDEPTSRRSEPLEDFSIAARQRMRDELNAQIEAFLARGGKINELPTAFSSVPPKKPASDFGGRAF